MSLVYTIISPWVWNIVGWGKYQTAESAWITVRGKETHFSLICNYNLFYDFTAFQKKKYTIDKKN